MSIKEYQKRLSELRLKVFGVVAKNLLKGDKEPYWLTEREIEGNRGRIGKALRLLSDNGYLGSVKGSGAHPDINRSHTKLHQILRFDEEGAQYGVLEEFDFDFDMFTLYSSGFENSPESTGFCMVRHLSHPLAIYVWYHQNEFRCIGSGSDKEFYPLAKEHQRDISIMRCFVEQYLACSYRDRFQELIGLKGSFPLDFEKSIVHRNIGYSPTLLSTESLENFETEYTHWVQYFGAYQQLLRSFRDTLGTLGGPEVVLKKMRCDCISELLHRAPLDINKEYLAPRALYILKHRDLIDYNVIYGQDASVTHIVNEGFDSDGVPQYDSVSLELKFFTAEPEDLAIAAQAKE